MNELDLCGTRWHRNTRVTSKMRAVCTMCGALLLLPKSPKAKVPRPLKKSLRCIQVWSQCEIYCCCTVLRIWFQLTINDIGHCKSPSSMDNSALFINLPTTHIQDGVFFKATTLLTFFSMKQLVSSQHHWRLFKVDSFFLFLIVKKLIQIFITGPFNIGVFDSVFILL